MATIAQIRGMLLEEALLYLLRLSGYSTVETAGSDPTLYDGSSGLEVLGRGGKHQIDAVADFAVAHPFSHPQRLLIEAKCYSDDKNHVGIEVIRNAVGVLKDVGEYWFSIKGVPTKARYHYQYAVFSATGYANTAEKYAFAQDIYLIPLARSRFIQPIIQSIRQITHQAFGATSWNTVDVDMTSLRKAIRSNLKNSNFSDLSEAIKNVNAQTLLENFCRICYQINGAVLAMIARQFPIFLVPNPRISIYELEPQYSVRIYWNNESWYLYSEDRPLFSFDIPTELFELYAEEGVLSKTRALNLKEEFMSEIQAVVTFENQIRVITLNLNRNWLNEIRNTYR